MTRDGTLDAASLRGAETLNGFLGEGRAEWRNVRSRLTELLGPAATHDERAAVERATLSRDAVRMHLPVAIGDYVDFYSSLEHATNVGRIFRPDAEPLLPNYRHVPIGYHGRSGTVVVSGTPIRRPRGQQKAPDAAAPTFGPSTMLDVELEMGWIAGGATTYGEPVSADAVREHVFGYVLLNDWSARDIQAWEYQPLGPFLAKSFATSISPWIVTLDALEPFRVDEPLHDPEPLPYLRSRKHWAYDIELELLLQTNAMRERDQDAVVDLAHELSRHVLDGRPAARARHLERRAPSSRATSSAPARSRAPSRTRYGSLLELTHRGANPIVLPSGETRAFLEDGDTVIIRGRAKNDTARVGFGDVVGTIVA